MRESERTRNLTRVKKRKSNGKIEAESVHREDQGTVGDSHPKWRFTAAATEVRPRSLWRPQTERGAVIVAPLASLFLSAFPHGQSPEEAERGGVTEGAVPAVITAAEAVVVVGNKAVNGLALANRRRRGQVVSPAGLGVITGGANAAAACTTRRVAVHYKAFSGEVSLNLGSAAAAASRSTLFCLARVSPASVSRSQTGAVMRRMVLLRFGVLPEDEAPEAGHAGQVRHGGPRQPQGHLLLCRQRLLLSVMSSALLK